MTKVNCVPPLCVCGVTADGREVLGGAFQLADTMGIPLWFALDQAKEKQCVISMPHYFASAIEYGWDDVQTFSRIRESLVDHGNVSDFENIKLGCIAIFTEVAKTMPGQSTTEIGRRMREMLEEGKGMSDIVNIRTGQV